MARVGAWPKDTPFEHAPTFDALRERSGLKAHALRKRLREVPCFKCPDNSVRYDEAAANDALEPEAGADELAAPEDSDAPTSGDPVATALVTTNRTLALFSATVRTLNETIKVMGEPQKRGLELTEKAVGVLLARLEKYDAMWDRMVKLVEDLQTTQDERDQKKAQLAARASMQRETFAMAKDVLPRALEKFSLTLEASAALDVLRSIDPDDLSAALDFGGLIPEEKVPQARKLVELLRKRRDEQRAKEQKSDAKPATAEASAPEATTAAPNGAAQEVPPAQPS